MCHEQNNIEQSAQEMEVCERYLQAAIEHAPMIPREETINQFSIHEVRPTSEWMEMVANVVNMIQQCDFEKVVLARDMQVMMNDPTGALYIDACLQGLR